MISLSILTTSSKNKPPLLGISIESRNAAPKSNDLCVPLLKELLRLNAIIVVTFTFYGQTIMMDMFGGILSFTF